MRRREKILKQAPLNIKEKKSYGREHDEEETKE